MAGVLQQLRAEFNLNIENEVTVQDDNNINEIEDDDIDFLPRSVDLDAY